MKSGGETSCRVGGTGGRGQEFRAPGVPTPGGSTFRAPTGVPTISLIAIHARSLDGQSGYSSGHGFHETFRTLVQNHPGTRLLPLSILGFGALAKGLKGVAKHEVMVRTTMQRSGCQKGCNLHNTPSSIIVSMFSALALIGAAAATWQLRLAGTFAGAGMLTGFVERKDNGA